MASAEQTGVQADGARDASVIIIDSDVDEIASTAAQGNTSGTILGLVALPEPPAAHPTVNDPQDQGRQPASGEAAAQLPEHGHASSRKRRASVVLDSDEEKEGSQQGEGDDDSTEANTCPICMEPWTESGEHQIVSITCGHFFGKSCITKWLHVKKKCPCCNARSKRHDIRHHFVSRKLAVKDTSMIESLKRNIRQEQEAREKLERENNQLSSKIKQLEEDVLAFRQQAASRLQHYTNSPMGAIGQHHRQGPSGSQWPLPQRGILTSVRKETLLSDLKEARCFAFDTQSARLYIPDKFNHQVVLRKASLLSPDTPRMVNLPLEFNDAVKDLQLDSSGRHALIAANKLLMMEVNNDTVAASYHLPAAAWSCCWDVNDRNVVYAGLRNGSIQVIDIRHGAGPMTTLAGRQPQVFTLVSLNTTTGVHAPDLISGNAHGVCGWGLPAGQQTQGTGYMAWQPLPIVSVQPICFSATYHKPTHTLVTSHYTNHLKGLPARHEVYTPNIRPGSSMSWSLSQTLLSCEMTCMARGDMFSMASSSRAGLQDGCWFLSGHEQDMSVAIWELGEGAGSAPTRMAKHNSSVMQVKAFPKYDHVLVASLSSTQFQLHKCTL